MNIDADKRKLIQYIDEHTAELVQFLQELVSIPSDNPPGDCRPLAVHIYKRLQEYRFSDVSLLEVNEDEVKDAGMIHISNVVAYQYFNQEDGPELTLNSHGDVVPPGNGWSADPYGGTVIDGKCYGRGAAVSKSDIASYTFAALALRTVAERLRGKISLAFTFDEETGGGLGPKWLLKNGHIQPDMAVCPGFSYSIVHAHNGCLHLELKLKGKQAHAAEPQHGHDALEAMSVVLQELYRYRKTLEAKTSNITGINSPTLVIGLISGGINTNVVPDECTIRIDRRLIPEEDALEAEKEINTLICNITDNFIGVTSEIKRIMLAQSFGPVSEKSPLIRAFQDNWQHVFDGRLPVKGSPLYTDARHFYETGVPVILYGAGPESLLEANGHRADENIKLDDLVKATKVVALSLFDLLSRNKGNGNPLS
jgi:acetylornithine deacetylase/succinyl-diaminopimelate desuccinylase family protein